MSCTTCHCSVFRSAAEGAHIQLKNVKKLIQKLRSARQRLPSDALSMLGTALTIESCDSLAEYSCAVVRVEAADMTVAVSSVSGLCSMRSHSQQCWTEEPLGMGFDNLASSGCANAGLPRNVAPLMNSMTCSSLNVWTAGSKRACECRTQQAVKVGQLGVNKLHDHCEDVFIQRAATTGTHRIRGRVCAPPSAARLV